MRSFKPLIMIVAAATVATSLGACSSYGGGSRYAYESPRQSCERNRSNNRVAGTVAGAAIGALAGSAIAGNSSNTAGTIIGGVAGAAVGSQVAKGRACPEGYYAYDPRYDGGRY